MGFSVPDPPPIPPPPPAGNVVRPDTLAIARRQANARLRRLSKQGLVIEQQQPGLSIGPRPY